MGKQCPEVISGKRRAFKSGGTFKSGGKNLKRIATTPAR